MLRLALFLSLVLALPAAAADKPLWGAARRGDSPAAVAAAFPDARPPIRSDTLNGGRLGLTLPGARIEDVDYDVRFYFDDIGLASVQLYREPPAGASAENVAHAKRIVAGLARQFGGLPVCKVITSSFAQHDCDWSATDREIGFFYMDVGGQSPMEIILFRPKKD